MSFIDLTGKRFGRLLVVRRGKDYIRKNGIVSVRWECKCDCGNSVLVRGSVLRNGESRSCGCYRSERMMVPHDYSVDGDVAYISIGGQRVLFDAEDLPKLCGKWWHISKNGYACSNKSKKTMHRVVMDAKNGDVIDHINRNKLDNRKANLRFADPSINAFNSTRKRGKTGKKYITFDSGSYKVQIGGKHIGRRKSLDEAVSLRDKAFEKSMAKMHGATI